MNHRANLIAIVVCALCVALFVGSQVIRVGTAKQNCSNVTTLRDAVSHVLTLADQQTPPGASADEFYANAQAELRKVKCGT